MVDVCAGLNQQLQHRNVVEQNRRRKGSIPVLTRDIRFQQSVRPKQRWMSTNCTTSIYSKIACRITDIPYQAVHIGLLQSEDEKIGTSKTTRRRD